MLIVPDTTFSVLGPVASAIAFLVFIPQAWSVWRNRDDAHSLRAISVTSNAFIVNNSILWGLYAWHLKEFWVGAAGIVNAPLAGMIIAIVFRADRRARRSHTGADKVE